MSLKITKNSEYIIRCESCPCEDWITNIDGGWRPTDTPSRYFKRNGWREINGKTLCSKCAKEASK